MYHQATYARFQLAFDDSQLAQVAEAEKRLGVRFPAAVREWYGRKDACKLIRQQDRIRPLEKLEVVEKDGGRHLIFLDESRVAWTVSCLLDGSENPKVLITGERLTRPHADSFSDAIFCYIFDWHGDERYRIPMAGAFSPLKNGELEMLQRRFPQKFPLTYNGFYRLGKSHRFDAGTFTLTLTITDNAEMKDDGLLLISNGRGGGMLLCQAKPKKLPAVKHRS